MFLLPGYSVGSIVIRLLVRWFNTHVFIARLQRWIHSNKIVGSLVQYPYFYCPVTALDP